MTRVSPLALPPPSCFRRGRQGIRSEATAKTHGYSQSVYGGEHISAVSFDREATIEPGGRGAGGGHAGHGAGFPADGGVWREGGKRDGDEYCGLGEGGMERAR